MDKDKKAPQSSGQMSDGVKIRAQIDAESVRNVLLLNGGGSVAVIALLPTVLGTPLVFAVLVTLSFWLAGLTFAAVHSVLRRKCSLVFERHEMRPPHGAKRFGINPKRPWVCWWSRNCLISSIVLFVFGGVAMVSISFANLDVLLEIPATPNQIAPSFSSIHNNSLKYDPALLALCRAH